MLLKIKLKLILNKKGKLIIIGQHYRIRRMLCKNVIEKNINSYIS